nr:lantibiotic dehydratase C-terminal domain-containing protein [Microtetraspora sp. NBRC 13810]
MLEAADGAGGPKALIRDWAALLHRYSARATELIASGRLPISDADTPAPRGLLRSDSLIDGLAANRHVRQFRNTVEYQRYRLLLNYTYGLLTRLRVKPVERGLLCHLAAATVENAFDVEFAARFRDFLDHPHELEGSHR